MSKLQGRTIIILLIFIVALFMIRNGNESKETQNKINACIDSCHSSIILKTNEDIPVLQACVNKCSTDNGGIPIYKP